MTSTIKVNNIQNQCGANIANKCGSTITLGASGDTITLACGASQTGFGRTGTVDWDTTAKTASFTAVSGNGYFVNTTSGAITATLPATPSAGDIVSIADYAGTAATNNITIARNGSNINGSASDQLINRNNSGITLVYVDGTQGWKGTETSNLNDIELQPEYIVATGGTVTCCGDYKIHTFTGPGTFTVCSVGNPIGSTSVDYLVVAGGGGTGGSADQQGGGGAGGFRLSNSTCMPAPLTSPLATSTGLDVTVTSYPIVVGAGGACGGSNPGSNSVFSTITSTGGGFGIFNTPGCGPGTAGSGGSGGGATNPNNTAGSGNTPPVSPPQGNPGGNVPARSAPVYGSGGGGGAGAAGQDGSPTVAGNGGIGSYVVSSGFAGCNGEPGPVCGAKYFAGGGGGGGETIYGLGGAGGGGNGSTNSGAQAENGATNTGGGAGSGNDCLSAGKSGGSGIVIIRYKYQ